MPWAPYTSDYTLYPLQLRRVRYAWAQAQLQLHGTWPFPHACRHCILPCRDILQLCSVPHCRCDGSSCITSAASLSGVHMCRGTEPARVPATTLATTPSCGATVWQLAKALRAQHTSGKPQAWARWPGTERPGRAGSGCDHGRRPGPQHDLQHDDGGVLGCWQYEHQRHLTAQQAIHGEFSATSRTVVVKFMCAGNTLRTWIL